MDEFDDKGESPITAMTDDWLDPTCSATVSPICNPDTRTNKVHQNSKAIKKPKPP